MIKNRISIASYSFHKLYEEKKIDVYGYLESLRYRYHLVDGDIWNGFLREMDMEDYKKIRKSMDDRGIRLASLCCDWAQPWSDDPEYGKQLSANAAKYLEAAKILGASTVRFDVGVVEEDISELQFETVCEKFSAYARLGAEAGFIVGPENHWGASRRLSLQQRLYKEINSPNYGMLLHVGNWNLEEGQTAAGNDLIAASMAVHTHIDYEHALTADQWLPGIIETGYSGAFSIEHHKALAEYEGTQAQLSAFLYSLSRQKGMTV